VRGRRPSVLITNDDGIDCEGLWHLAGAAAQAGWHVVVAAPAKEASGSSAAMHGAFREGRRIEAQRRDLPPPAAGLTAYAVDGTPALIATLAAWGGFGGRPDYLLSGINRGPNTGQGVLHSGTVGAALTAAGHGIPAIAFSLDVDEGDDTPPHWPTAAQVATEVIPVLAGLSGVVTLNVNVPNIPPVRFGGIRLGHLATFGAFQMQVSGPVSGHDAGYLQISLEGAQPGPQPGSDSALLSAGQACVTPLHGVGAGSAAGLPWPLAPGSSLLRTGK
jgi:5'-nucleotidase